jgi:hypothetical protein
MQLSWWLLVVHLPPVLLLIRAGAAACGTCMVQVRSAHCSVCLQKPAAKPGGPSIAAGGNLLTKEQIAKQVGQAQAEQCC